MVCVLYADRLTDKETNKVRFSLIPMKWFELFTTITITTMRIKRGVRQVRTLQIERYLLPRLCYLMINVMLIYSQCLYSWMKLKVRVYYLQLQPVPELVRVLSINYSLLIKWIIVTYLLSVWFLNFCCYCIPHSSLTHPWHSAEVALLLLVPSKIWIVLPN